MAKHPRAESAEKPIVLGLHKPDYNPGCEMRSTCHHALLWVTRQGLVSTQIYSHSP